MQEERIWLRSLIAVYCSDLGLGSHEANMDWTAIDIHRNPYVIELHWKSTLPWVCQCLFAKDAPGQALQMLLN